MTFVLQIQVIFFSMCNVNPLAWCIGTCIGIVIGSADNYDIIFCCILTHDVFSSLPLSGDWELMHEALSVSCIIKHIPFFGKCQKDVMYKICFQHYSEFTTLCVIFHFAKHPVKPKNSFEQYLWKANIDRFSRIYNMFQYI